jgi:hypothetical protein
MTTEEFKQLEEIEARKRLRWRRFAELIRGGFDPSMPSCSPRIPKSMSVRRSISSHAAVPEQQRFASLSELPHRTAGG